MSLIVSGGWRRLLQLEFAAPSLVIKRVHRVGQWDLRTGPLAPVVTNLPLLLQERAHPSIEQARRNIGGNRSHIAGPPSRSRSEERRVRKVGRAARAGGR